MTKFYFLFISFSVEGLRKSKKSSSGPEHLHNNFSSSEQETQTTMLSSFMHDDFFFDPFDHRMHRHNTRSFLQQPVFQGFIDDFDMSGPFRESSKTADEDPQQQGPCFSALSFSQVTTQDHTGSGVQETRREFSDSKGQFKREHKKHALDVPLQKDLSVTKAQLEADQAVKQAERTLKMARRAQREAKKNAEKSACAN